MDILKKIPFSPNQAVVFDIDDTLIDTAGTTIQASKGVERVFEKRFNKEEAKKVKKTFDEIFNLIRGQLQERKIGRIRREVIPVGVGTGGKHKKLGLACLAFQ